MPRGVRKGEVRKIPDWFIEQLVDEEDIIEAKNGTLRPDKLVKFRCSKCGTEVTTRLRNKVEMSTGKVRRGCRVCTSKKSMADRRNNREDFPDWFIDSIYLEEDRERARNKELVMTKKIQFKCDKGHIYSMRPNDRIVRTKGIENHGCYLCNRYSYQRGRWEDEVDSLLNPSGLLRVEKNYTGVISNERGKHYEIDLYYPDLKLCVECNGSYWHATLGKALKAPKEKNYHYNKFIKCKEKGLRLVSLFDVDFNDKMKDFLREITSEKEVLYARNLSLLEVGIKEAREFCERYHLLGYSTQGNIRYGLFDGKELVCLMTFGRARFGGDGYELVRYVVKFGKIVVGGPERLLKRFERDYNSQRLLSYSDNDYFIGSMYERLGFNEDGQTSLDYYWWNPRTFEKLTRQECSVKELKKRHDKVTTEDETMVEMGFNKIYRCGSTRWIKIY